MFSSSCLRTRLSSAFISEVNIRMHTLLFPFTNVVWVVYKVWAFLFSDTSCNFVPGGHSVTFHNNTEDYLCKEMSGPKFELQNEKLLLTTLTHYCLSCLRFVAFSVAKTFQNTLVKWSWKSFMHILWNKLQIYLQL